MDNVPKPLPAKPERFFDQYRAFIRLDGKSYATENTYALWAKQFILFHDKRHPNTLGKEHVEAFLSHLVLECNASTSTQRTALNALVFLYNRFLKIPLENLNFKYSSKSTRIPTVFSHQEAMAVINALEQPYRLMGQLMYGSGLRVSEVVRLRVKDVDFKMNYLVIREGKGAKDRTTLLPQSLIPALHHQILVVEKQLELDQVNGVGDVYLPHLLSKKYPSAGKSLEWQFLFPSYSLSIDPRAQIERRHHIYRSTLQAKVKQAIKSARITKQASCHTFRHSFATSLLQHKYDLRQIQKLMGHNDIRTTEIYLHVLENLGQHVKSPLDV
jgi:integron integrase